MDRQNSLNGSGIEEKGSNRRRDFDCLATIVLDSLGDNISGYGFFIYGAKKELLKLAHISFCVEIGKRKKYVPVVVVGRNGQIPRDCKAYPVHVGEYLEKLYLLRREV